MSLQSPQSNYFTGSYAKGDVPDLVSNTQVFDLQQDFAGRCRLVSDKNVLEFLANHQADQVVVADVFVGQRAGVVAIFEDGDVVGDFHHLVQTVGDKSQSPTLLLEFSHDAEQVRHFLSGQNGGRFI